MEGKFQIRGIREADRPALEHICLVTARGLDLEKPLEKQAIAAIYCHYYLDYQREYGFTVAAEKSVGYILCAPDYDRFAGTMKEFLSHTDNPLIREIGESEIEDLLPFAGEYPAHLHIDLLPEIQGKGWGSRLIDRLKDELREMKVPGLVLQAGADNTGAIRFYERNGFTTLDESGGTVTMGIRL